MIAGAYWKRELRIKRKLQFAAATWVLLMLGVEIGLRVLAPRYNWYDVVYQPQAAFNDLWIVPDPQTHHRMKRALRDRRVLHDGLTYEIRTNWEGFRDHDWDLGDPARTRVAFFGDSYVMANEVEPAERFTDILDRELGPNFEVMNCGTTSWCPMAYERVLPDLIERYGIDVVVIFLDFTDVADAMIYEKHLDPGSGEFRFLPRDVMPDYYELQTKGLTGWLRVNLRLYFALAEFKNHMLSRGDVPAGPREEYLDKAALDPADELFHDAIESTGQSLDRIQRTCDSTGVRSVFVTYPWSLNVDNTEQRDCPFLQAFRSDRRPFPCFWQVHEAVFPEQAPVIHLTDRFRRIRSENPDQPFYLGRNSHFNPTGHRVVAKLLLEEGRRMGLWPETKRN
jgi:hypothetical protein